MRYFAVRADILIPGHIFDKVKKIHPEMTDKEILKYCKSRIVDSGSEILEKSIFEHIQSSEVSSDN